MNRALFPISVYCFPNGTTGVCKDGKQVPEAQMPWLLLIAEQLNKVGLNPLEAIIMLPNGMEAQFFRCGDGTLNWKLLQ